LIAGEITMSQTNAFQLVIHPDPAALARAAAERIIDCSRRAIEARGRFLLVLAGGSTPEKAYELLAQPDQAARIDWSKTFAFFGDERVVPHDDPRSNFHMASRALLSHVPIPRLNVFPIPTDRGSPAECASAYSHTLEDFFGSKPGQTLPRFDLILLGMGDDGHTASLFPGKPALHEQKAWVVSSPPGVLPPPVDRVTMTFPVLSAGREVMFLVTGEKKAGPAKEILEGPPNPDVHPSSGVRPTEGILIWFVDEAAARLLSKKP
jgi:6-phosphogluconolactonase